jgi:two-component system OmpR family sensor kinase
VLLNSVRNRLVLLFFAITGAAVGFVYLYVVPQLTSSLTAEKLSRLETAAAEVSPRFGAAMSRGATQEELRGVVRTAAQDAEARVTLLGVAEGETGLEPRFVISDSELERTAVRPSYRPAFAAVGSGQLASGAEVVDGERIGEVATVLSRSGEPRWVAVLSAPLDDVEDNVALIRRQILIAGVIAIAAALLAGWFAATTHSRRLRRLENAAEKVAEGNLNVPIPIDSGDEVGQLAMSFDEMQQRLARLDSARREFIANASHELRTPIFSLGGFVELLEEEEEPDPESRREFVHAMREQVDRLSKLTVDLLDLSKLDAGALEISAEELDLGVAAADAAREFGPAAELHRSALDVDGPADSEVIAVADPVRVAQILRILVDNALRHTPDGTAIRIEAERSDGACKLTVRDDGPGIDPADRARVFERFHTGDSASGSGLGLAIARELAERMGGGLTLVSRRGRTSFTLTLPPAPVARGS